MAHTQSHWGEGEGGGEILLTHQPGDSVLGTSTSVSDLRPPASPVLIGAESGTADGGVEIGLMPTLPDGLSIFCNIECTYSLNWTSETGKDGRETTGAVVTAVTGGEGEEVVTGFLPFETKVC